MHFFDFDTVASKAGISADSLAQLQEIMRGEFPGDEMMSELHVLRACMAIRDGLITLEDALGEKRSTEEDLGITA